MSERDQEYCNIMFGHLAIFCILNTEEESLHSCNGRGLFGDIHMLLLLHESHRRGARHGLAEKPLLVKGRQNFGPLEVVRLCDIVATLPDVLTLDMRPTFFRPFGDDDLVGEKN